MFNPVNDYSFNNTNDEKRIIYWKFQQLIVNLYTLSYPANEQRYIIGYGCATDEMAIDFDTYYTNERDNYLKFGLLNTKQKILLDDLNTFFDEQSGADSDFWDDTALDKNNNWDIVRQKAKLILQALKMDNLRLIIERNTNLKAGLLTESTLVKLQNKNNV